MLADWSVVIALIVCTCTWLNPTMLMLTTNVIGLLLLYSIVKREDWLAT